jgi:SAM-dependent methyltransferase
MRRAAASWERCYEANATNWDLGVPAPPLLRGAEALQRGRAVVVGCGKGHDAIAIAALGFRVTAVDFAPSAIEATARAAKARKLKIELLEEDVLRLPAKLEPFAYWFEHTCFCAIEPAQREAYVEAAHATLEPGGHLLALFHAHARSGGPPYGTNRREIERLFQPRFGILSMENPQDSHPKRKGEELLALFQKR